MQQSQPALALIGRLLIALIFIVSGVAKLTTPAETQAHIASFGLPLPLLGYGIALAAELGCGLLLLVGYRIRSAAALLALFSLATAVLFHHDFADRAEIISFLKNLAMAGGLLQIVAFGAPAFSLDARRNRAAA